MRKGFIELTLKDLALNSENIIGDRNVFISPVQIEEQDIYAFIISPSKESENNIIVDGILSVGREKYNLDLQLFKDKKIIFVYKLEDEKEFTPEMLLEVIAFCDYGI